MQISELARAAQLTTRQLRHYEREGLIAPDRGTNGYRTYSLQAVALARRIGLLVDLGFTTAEIRGFLDRIEEPSKDRADLAERKRRLARIDAALADLRQKRAELIALLVAEEPLGVEE